MHSHLREDPRLLHAASQVERYHPDQYEIYYEHTRTTEIESKDSQVDSLTQAEDAGLSIRIIRDRRLGFSFTTSLEADAITAAVKSAFAVAEHMPEDPHLDFPALHAGKAPHVEQYDQRGVELPLSSKIARAVELEQLCRSSDSRITAVRSANLSETTLHRALLNGQKGFLEARSTRYTASLTCKAESGGDSQMGGDFDFSAAFETLPWKQVAKRSASLAVELLLAGSAPTMKCPAILRNSVVAELLEFLSSSFSAEEISKGRSLLAGRQGQRVFSPLLTLMDDGLLPGGYASRGFDAEGTLCRKTLLVEKGVLLQSLCDHYFAKKLGIAPTGAAVRGVKFPPRTGFNNLYLQNGSAFPEQLVGGISKGILITDLMGIHTANPVTGDFSLGASGLLIEKGKTASPVRGFAVAGNLLGILSQVNAVGNDLRFFGSVGAPSVQIEELSIGGV